MGGAFTSTRMQMFVGEESNYEEKCSNPILVTFAPIKIGFGQVVGEVHVQ